jgi:hypothetical protein
MDCSVVIWKMVGWGRLGRNDRAATRSAATMPQARRPSLQFGSPGFLSKTWSGGKPSAARRVRAQWRMEGECETRPMRTGAAGRWMPATSSGTLRRRMIWSRA